MKLSHYFIFFKKHRISVILVALFALHIFLRFYQLEARMSFGWDQLDNAWAAKNIIIDHEFPIIGMQAKLNSGIYIGPIYYYLISIVYFFTNLDPIASGIFAGITSIFSFSVFFYITKQLLSVNIALLTVFIYVVSYYATIFDRSQWPVNFIMATSYIIFFALYNILLGKEKYLILLAFAVGFMFHIHFTAVFYPIIILLSLPFFPRSFQVAKYVAISFCIVSLFLSPIIISMLSKQSSGSFLSYINTYYHGVHLVRIYQLTHDAFIKFDSILKESYLSFVKYIVVPLFLGIYFFTKPEKKRFLLCYLVALWFIIPWLVFSVYSGEISDYYFSSTLPFVYLTLAYLSMKVYQIKNYIPKMLILLFWIYFTYNNLNSFFHYNDSDSLLVKRIKVNEKIKNNEFIKFQHGLPESYLYYLYLRKEGKKEIIKTYFNSNNQ